MRLQIVTLLITLGCMHAAASGSAQPISLKVKEASLKQVFAEIQKQTSYRFMYANNLLDDAKPVTLELKAGSLKEVLEQVFKNQPLTYKIYDQTIVIDKKTNSILNNLQTYLKTIVIQGKVTNEQGAPLQGVNISIKGASTRAVTDNNGNYRIEADENSTLIFSFIGYQTIEAFVNGKKQMNIKLLSATGELDQVQVIAYGTTTRRLNTGNVGSVKAETLAQQPITNPLQGLSGRISGVQVTQASGLPGSPITVRIRGRNSIDASSDPLYIIDGVQFTSNSVDRLIANFGKANPMNMISPDNIERIDVLKDADATAIYGSRAANGVILITTKKGKSGKSSLDVHFNSGFSKITRTPKVLSTQQYLQIRKDALSNSNLTPTASNAPDLVNYDQSAYFDWQDWYMGGSPKQNTLTTTFSGGNQQTNFLLSGTFHQESTVRRFDGGYKRGNVHLGVNHVSVDNRFRLSASFFYTIDRNLTQFDAQGSVSDIVRFGPNYPIYNAAGGYNWVNSKRNYISSFNGYLKNNGNNLNVNSAISYNLIPGLDIKSNFGFNRISSDQVQPTPSTALDPNLGGMARSEFGNMSYQVFIIEPQIAYTKVIGHGSLNTVGGVTIQQSSNNETYLSVSNYTSDLLLESPTFGTPFVTGTNTPYKYLSVFSRLTYNLRDKYIINGTFRRDGSSRFGPGKQFGNFGSFGAAWLFYKDINWGAKWLSFGKLRGSYGVTGSDGIGDYGFSNLYSASAMYGTQNAIVPNQIGNSNFQWERTKKLEFAIDLGFFKDRILLNASWYRNRSSNQLVQYSLPTLTGFSGYTANLPAVVENRGWEFELSSINIHKRDFEWSTSFNLTIPKNKLVSFPGLETTSSYANSYILGQSLNVIQKLNFLGVDPATGLSIIEDVNKDNAYTLKSSYNQQNGDLVIAGSTDPKWYGGINNSLAYKRLELNIFVQFTKQLGYNLYSQGSNLFGRTYNFWTDYLNYWKQPNDVASLPKPFAASNVSLTNFFNSNAGISDASFVRLKNIQVSYNLPSKLTQKVKIERLRIYFQGQNLWTITGFKGYDPEQATSPIIGIPTLKTFAAGIQCTF